MSKNRPISDDVTNKAQTLPPNNSAGRRLSDIFEDRRSSMPEQMLKLKEFQQLNEKSEHCCYYLNIIIMFSFSF